MDKFKLLNVILLVASLVSPVFTSGQESAAGRTAATDRTTFYDVPLKCPAAPQIACGGRSKPVLFSLERRAAVDEAWVNRSGTVVAVVWKGDSTAAARNAVIADIASLHDLPFRELGKDERVALQQTFASRTDWYRGVDTGKLSEEEAHIIAARLVRRLVAKAPTAAPKADSLSTRLFDVMRPAIMDDAGRSVGHVDLVTLQSKLLATARDQLDAAEFSAFEDALILPGFRPMGDEP